MSPTDSGHGYLVLAYAVSLALLWGYAIMSWIEVVRLQRRRRRQDPT